MSNLVRRFAPRPLAPTRGEGPPEEADLVEAPAGPGDDRRSEAVLESDGRYSPRFKRFAVGVAPPAPSAYYRTDPHYVRGTDIHHDTRMRAIANFNSWRNRHG